MKLFAFAILALSLPLGSALAQTNSAPSAAAPAPGATSKFSIDTPIETIAADPAAAAVLEANFPGTTKHAMYDSFKSMSLRQLQPAANGAISDEALAKIDKELRALK